MSAAGDAVVVYRAPAPGDTFARYRPAGGSWGASQLVLDSPYFDQMQELMAEFDGGGRAVAVAVYREFNHTVRVNVRGAGAAGTWGATDQVLDDDGDQSLPNPPPSFDQRNLDALVRHPQGAVAAWTRRATSTSSNYDIVVSRLSGAGWDTPKVFDIPDRLYGASAATNAAGEILLAGTLNSGTGSGVENTYASIAPSLTGAWPDMTRVSPPAGSKLYRTPVAGGGGTAFYVAWSVHGAGDGTEMISTKTPGTCATPTPTPTADADADAHRRRRRRPQPRRRRRPQPRRRRRPQPPTATATATAAPSPQPLPAQPTPSATPKPAIQSTVGPSAIADFTSAARGLEVRPRPEADRALQEAPEGLHGQDDHGAREQQEGRDDQGRQAQEAAVPAQAAEAGRSPSRSRSR